MRKPKLFENQNNSLLYRFLAFPGKDSDTVRHQALLAHRIISSSARVTFLISLVVTLCFYPSIPAETGVHLIGVAFMPETHGFSAKIHRFLHEYQEIDVVAEKDGCSILMSLPHSFCLPVCCSHGSPEE